MHFVNSKLHKGQFKPSGYLRFLFITMTVEIHSPKIFCMHNSDPTPQGVENINILLWLKCVLTALHVNCMIMFQCLK